VRSVVASLERVTAVRKAARIPHNVGGSQDAVRESEEQLHRMWCNMLSELRERHFLPLCGVRGRGGGRFGGRGDDCETFGNGRTEGRLNYFHLTRNEIRQKHKRFATMVGHTGGGSQQQSNARGRWAAKPLKRRISKGWQNFRARDRYGRWGLVPKDRTGKAHAVRSQRPELCSPRLSSRVNAFRLSWVSEGIRS
jgi:hypothetical protein